MKDVFEYIAALLILFAATIGTAFRQEITQWGSFCRVADRIEADSPDAKTAEWRDRVISAGFQ